MNKKIEDEDEEPCFCHAFANGRISDKFCCNVFKFK